MTHRIIPCRVLGERAWRIERASEVGECGLRVILGTAIGSLAQVLDAIRSRKLRVPGMNER